MGYAFARGERGFRSLSVRTQLSVPALKKGSLMCRVGAAGGLHMELKDSRNSEGTVSSS